MLQLCDLKALEILDLGRNKIRILPPEIAKLASLKVLAVQKNRIEELPLCLADMVSLQVLKLDGNRITFPPREVLQVQASSPPHEGYLNQTEVTEVTVTAHIRKFLKQKILEKAEAVKTAEVQHIGEDGGEGFETPRVAIKRVASGRFPIRVNGIDAADPRSPNLSRPPPIPSRNHARGLSQQNGPMRRPGVMPLTIGNPNERLRSNSESLMQVSRVNGATDRQRRMGIMSKRANDLGTLDETQADNRLSHYRGLSHGSSMNPNLDPSMANSISPNSPAEPLLHRPDYVRRLSVLPEQRRESKVFDPIIQSAEGILYSLFQIHPFIQLCTRLTNDGTTKRSSLEIVFYNTNVHVEELEQEIQKHDVFINQNGFAPRENENVQRAVLTLINAYSHICSLLITDMDAIVDKGNPRYIRTLITLLYNSVMELRVTANEASLGSSGYNQDSGRQSPSIGGTIKPHSRDPSVTPTPYRPGLGSRSRNASFAHNPSNLRVATDVTMPFANPTGRSATVVMSTPRSGESFASNITDPRSLAEISAEEHAFEQIFLALSKATDMVMRTLPHFNTQFNGGWRNARSHRAPEHVLQTWRALIGRCGQSIQQTDLLRGRLSTIKLKESGVRTDMGFWSLCKSFIDSWAEYGNMLRYAMDHVHLPVDIRTRLRPVQLRIKETTQLIVSSPWVSLFRQAGHADNTNYYSPEQSAANPIFTPVQLPMTPQSAALGSAAQATVPSTPQSVAFANALNGNVFERADTLLSMGAGMPMSRTGTMTSTSGASITSFSSITSGHEERYGPQTGVSPNGVETGSISFRRNGGGRVAF